jgi:hypothetical protein
VEEERRDGDNVIKHPTSVVLMMLGSQAQNQLHNILSLKLSPKFTKFITLIALMQSV